jgi:carboxyl-terminal processing protease
MARGRVVLLLVSLAVIGLVFGGGWTARVGAEDSPYRKAVLFSEVLSLVLENYVDPVEADRLLDGAYEGMLSGLDARSAFLTPAEVEEWNAPAGDRSADPGVTVLRGFGGFQIVAVEPESPADRAGIRAGDQIRRVDGRDLSELSLDQGLRLLRGPSGTTVRLDVVHPDDGFRRETLEVDRARRAQAAYDLELRDGVAVVHVRDLPRIDTERLARELDDARSNGADSLMLDLRAVANEDARVAAPVAGLFVDGDLFSLRPRTGDDGEETVATAAAPGGAAWSGRLGLLVNGATAGAGEALAAVLQERASALLFGESTYGLGSEPELFLLPDGSGVLLSARVWELPGGGSWDRDGLEPDEEIRGTGTDLAERLERQFDEALRRFRGEDAA